ncbi:hypothetical protein ACHAPX_002600 [Trichoderma viride]
MLAALFKTQSDFHAISTLLEWLKDSLQEEEKHWSIIDSFGRGSTLEKLAAVDFEQMLDSICVLSGVEPGKNPPNPLALDCMVLQSMQERLKDSFLERPIQCGGPTTLEKFRQRWKSVIRELKPGKMGAPMREYLGMLGKGLDPMTEDSPKHIKGLISANTDSNDDVNSEHDGSIDHTSEDSDV